jgi:hypothetical protein
MFFFSLSRKQKLNLKKKKTTHNMTHSALISVQSEFWGVRVQAISTQTAEGLSSALLCCNWLAEGGSCTAFSVTPCDMSVASQKDDHDEAHLCS